MFSEDVQKFFNGIIYQGTTFNTDLFAKGKMKNISKNKQQVLYKLRLILQKPLSFFTKSFSEN